MISKNKVKFIKSLQNKKHRNEEQCFLVEGAKNVLELLQSDYKIITIVYNKNYFPDAFRKHEGKVELIEATEKELALLGTFQTNQTALAIAEMKHEIGFIFPKGEYVLALDNVRDPGNLGTMIRIADWYGIKHLLCTEETAEFYNPKVINASMGSFTRVKMYYDDIVKTLSSIKITKYGAFMSGEDVHHVHFENEGFIVMGNESVGISKEVEQVIDKKITIPGYGKAESLNVAIATAVICDNLKRIKG